MSHDINISDPLFSDEEFNRIMGEAERLSNKFTKEDQLAKEETDIHLLEMSIKGKLDIEHGVYLSSIIKEFT